MRARMTHQVEDAGDHAPQCVDVLALEADGAHGVVDGAEVGLVVDGRHLCQQHTCKHMTSHMCKHTSSTNVTVKQVSSKLVVARDYTMFKQITCTCITNNR